jgi:hypothetical protein
MASRLRHVEDHIGSQLVRQLAQFLSQAKTKTTTEDMAVSFFV